MSIGSTSSSTAITGNVTVVQPTGTNLHAVVDSGTITTVSSVTAIAGALPAGSNVIGHIIADSGSTTAVTGTVTVAGTVTANAGTNLNTSALATVAKQPALGTAGTASADVLTVQGITSMTPLSVTVAAGSAVIGHVITDSGSTTAVTGNVTAVQATGSNLHTVIDSGTITTVSAVTAISNALPAGSNVIGHVINDASSAVIGHIIADSGSTTAVTQATATNLNAAVVGTGTAGSAAGGVLTVQGVASMTKLLVTPDSVALPANQSVNVAQINAVTPLMGSGNTGTGSLRVTIATDQPQLTNKLLVTPDANSAVNVAQIGGTNSVTAGVNGTLAVGGNVATNVAIGTNPINNGAQAVSSENTAVTATRMAQLVCDLVGKLIVLPYANPENFVSGAITSAMTGTTTTSLIGAPASGLRNYITQITVSNSHATVGTDIIIQDGSGGTTLYTIPAAALYGGATVTFPTPLRQPTTATAIFCANVTTGASTKVSASGYKGA